MSIGKPYEPHTREFAEEMTKPGAHTAIVNAADMMLRMAAKLYGNPELMQQMKAEHKAYRGY